MSNKFKDFYKKHVDKIVILLVLLLIMKSCGKSGIERRMDFTTNRYELSIDSLNSVIEVRDSIIDSLNNVNSLLIKDIEHLTQTNKSLSTSNDYYKAANKVLINSNKDLIKTNSKNKQ